MSPAVPPAPPAAPSRLWIAHPWVDLVVGCGGWSLPLLALSYALSGDSAREWAGAFYALVDLRDTGLSSRELSRALLEEERVAAAPGDTFGAQGEGMVRISLASSDDDVAEGCRRIIAFARRYTAERMSTRATAELAAV